MTMFNLGRLTTATFKSVNDVCLWSAPARPKEFFLMLGLAKTGVSILLEDSGQFKAFYRGEAKDQIGIVVNELCFDGEFASVSAEGNASQFGRLRYGNRGAELLCNVDGGAQWLPLTAEDPIEASEVVSGVAYHYFDDWRIVTRKLTQVDVWCHRSGGRLSFPMHSA